MKKITPYKGEKNYIFISYAHKDSDQVLEILKRMQGDGYRFWFDGGIDPGTEWDENIAAHINGCDYFIAFVSGNYLDSDNCKDELNFARDLNKKRLIVYLEEVELPAGMAMRMNRLQSIFHYRYQGAEDFYKMLYSAESIDQFVDAPQPVLEETPEIVSEPSVAPTEEKTVEPDPPKTTATSTISATPQPSSDHTFTVTTYSPNRKNPMVHSSATSGVPDKPQVRFLVMGILLILLGGFFGLMLLASDVSMLVPTIMFLVPGIFLTIHYATGKFLKATMIIVCLFVGIFGIHRFVAGKVGTGILWMLTMGCFFLGVIIDVLRIALNSFPIYHLR